MSIGKTIRLWRCANASSHNSDLIFLRELKAESYWAEIDLCLQQAIQSAAERSAPSVSIPIEPLHLNTRAASTYIDTLKNEGVETGILCCDKPA